MAQTKYIIFNTISMVYSRVFLFYEKTLNSKAINLGNAVNFVVYRFFQKLNSKQMQKSRLYIISTKIG